MLTLGTDGPDQTRALAAVMAPLLAVGDLLVLTGDLGAGKTCFAQGLGRGLGIDDRITSPTFTLASRYHGRLTLHHLDVYRLDSVAETMDLDLPELLESGLTVIEWGDQILSVLPDQYLLVALRFPQPAEGPDAAGSDTKGLKTAGSDTKGLKTAGFDAAGFEETARIIELIGHGRRWRELWPALTEAVQGWAR
jgi:tRNA threonylcarbamoyladenosine biosynthesis protein TsaE